MHTPTVIVLPCLLWLVPNAHVQRYTQWMAAEWDRIGGAAWPALLVLFYLLAFPLVLPGLYKCSQGTSLQGGGAL